MTKAFSVSPSGSPVQAERHGMIVRALGERTLVLVGMMGAGKTVVGRRLAGRLALPFADADHAIEEAAQLTVPEIFARHGEAHFRDRESKVVARLIRGGPRVVATGGGSFMHPDTRRAIHALGVSIWLKADFEVLMRRVRKRSNRPLLQTADPEATLRGLIATRYPVYAEADLTVVSRDAPHETIVEEVIVALEGRLGLAATPSVGWTP